MRMGILSSKVVFGRLETVTMCFQRIILRDDWVKCRGKLWDEICSHIGSCSRCTKIRVPCMCDIIGILQSRFHPYLDPVRMESMSSSVKQKWDFIKLVEVCKAMNVWYFHDTCNAIHDCTHLFPIPIRIVLRKLSSTYVTTRISSHSMFLICHLWEWSLGQATLHQTLHSISVKTVWNLTYTIADQDRVYTARRWLHGYPSM
jgi:hypothetical protein